MEIIIVVAIIGIIMSLVLVSFGKQQKKGRDNVRVADIQNLRLALDSYRLNCGEFPARLDLAANNGCESGVTFGDFILEIPVSPSYADGHNLFPTHGQDYFYAGLSTTTNGRCYEYHIATQLEYGADSNFADGEQSALLSADHDFEKYGGSTYTKKCQSAQEDFVNADDDSYGLYDFRSTKHNI